METRLLGSGPGGDGCFRVVLRAEAGPVVGLELRWRDEPDLPWRRRWLNQSTYWATAISTSLTDFHPPSGRMTRLRMHSVLNSEFSASAVALTPL